MLVTSCHVLAAVVTPLFNLRHAPQYMRPFSGELQRIGRLKAAPLSLWQLLFNYKMSATNLLLYFQRALCINQRFSCRIVTKIAVAINEEANSLRA